jgi:hypothetical protein
VQADPLALQEDAFDGVGQIREEVPAIGDLLGLIHERRGRRILRSSKPARRVYRSHASVRSYPASASTAWAPTPISEATLPSASTSTADGVPVAPKARPVENC